MKKLFYPLFILLAIAFSQACGDRPTNEEQITPTAQSVQATPKHDTTNFPKGKIIEKISCLSDPGQTFALYIPPATDAAMPVMYCFDPHGDGTLPLRLYRSLADKFRFIMVGSNNSKNGNDWQTTQAIVSALMNDVPARLSIRSARQYTAGFSGGAKVAVWAALHQPAIKGVIAAGAGFPEGETLGRTDFSFTGMAGRGDMNMAELVALNTELDQSALRHRLILFDGKHAWPPVPVMETAFTALQLDAMRDRSIAGSDLLPAAYAAHSKARTQALIQSHRLLQAQQETTLSSQLLEGFPAFRSPFLLQDSLLKQDPLFVSQQATAQKIFTTEQQKKQAYQQQLQQGNMQYWTQTIRELKKGASGSGEEGAMNQRLLAYLSLLFYSVSNQLIGQNQTDGARFFVSLYKLADPTNSEAWFFSALLNARANDLQAAGSDLRQAAALGFTDSARLMREPALQSLLSVLRHAGRK